MSAASWKGRVDFGIITIREDEFEAVLQRFPGAQARPRPPRPPRRASRRPGTERSMKFYPYVVFAERLRGFDTLDEAKAFAQANVPSVICERRRTPEGASQLVEILRHDFLYDRERKEWRIMMG